MTGPVTIERRAAILGCGRIAGGYNEANESAILTHAVAYRRLGARLVACCDADGAQASRFAARWGIERAGTDWAALLAETRPAVVSICTPPAARLDPVRAALAAPSVRAVLLEKPLCTTGTEARAIVALANEHAKPLLVNFPRAFDPFYARAEREARDGTLGTLRQGVALYYGSAVTNASHWIERLLALFGAPRSARRLAGTPEAPVAELQFEAGLVLLLPAEGTRCSPFELDLLFEGQRLRVIDSERRAEHFQSMPDPAFPGYFNLARTTDWDTVAPSHEALGHAVAAACGLAAGEAIEVDWRALLDRAAATVEILETIGASA